MSRQIWRPLVSIVTPSLNQAVFLRAAIESVRAQNYPRVEHIVIDGASSDGSVDLLRGYGSAVTWVSEPDAGQSAAVNKGWSLARGEVLGWLNADDTLEPVAVSSAVDALCQDPSVDLVYGDCDYIGGSGEWLSRFPTRPFDLVRLATSTENFIPQPAAFLRRSVFENTGGLDESLHFVMDLDFWLRASLRHRFGYVPVKLANLRLHGTAKSLARMGAFPAELVGVYSAFFARDDLPEPLRHLKRRALSSAEYLLADRAFWGGDVRQARAHAARAWRLAPGRPRRQLLLSALGAPARQLLTRFGRNPLERFPYVV